MGLEEELRSLTWCFLWLEPSEQHFPELSQRHAVFVGAVAATYNFETFRQFPTRSDTRPTQRGWPSFLTSWPEKDASASWLSHLSQAGTSQACSLKASKAVLQKALG